MNNSQPANGLTNDWKEKYISDGGTWCPYCGNTDLNRGTPFKITGKKILQRISCIECNSAWHNEYLLINIIEDN